MAVYAAPGDPPTPPHTPDTGIVDPFSRLDPAIHEEHNPDISTVFALQVHEARPVTETIVDLRIDTFFVDGVCPHHVGHLRTVADHELKLARHFESTMIVIVPRLELFVSLRSPEVNVHVEPSLMFRTRKQHISLKIRSHVILLSL